MVRRDWIARLVRFIRLWNETSEPIGSAPNDPWLSDTSYRYWMTRIERQERNGAMRRD